MLETVTAKIQEIAESVAHKPIQERLEAQKREKVPFWREFSLFFFFLYML